jgi:hypothetical protein
METEFHKIYTKPRITFGELLRMGILKLKLITKKYVLGFKMKQIKKALLTVPTITIQGLQDHIPVDRHHLPVDGVLSPLLHV